MVRSFGMVHQMFPEHNTFAGPAGASLPSWDSFILAREGSSHCSLPLLLVPAISTFNLESYHKTMNKEVKKNSHQMAAVKASAEIKQSCI